MHFPSGSTLLANNWDYKLISQDKILILSIEITLYLWPQGMKFPSIMNWYCGGHSHRSKWSIIYLYNKRDLLRFNELCLRMCNRYNMNEWVYVDWIEVKALGKIENVDLCDIFLYQLKDVFNLHLIFFSPWMFYFRYIKNIFFKSIFFKCHHES